MTIGSSRLGPPVKTKQFLISPPASPPVGWTSVEESAPTPVDYNLLAALSRLRLRGTVVCVCVCVFVCMCVMCLYTCACWYVCGVHILAYCVSCLFLCFHSPCNRYKKASKSILAIRTINSNPSLAVTTVPQCSVVVESRTC